jgi:hypothetical protein
MHKIQLHEQLDQSSNQSSTCAGPAGPRTATQRATTSSSARQAACRPHWQLVGPRWRRCWQQRCSRLRPERATLWTWRPRAMPPLRMCLYCWARWGLWLGLVCSDSVAPAPAMVCCAANSQPFSHIASRCVPLMQGTCCWLRLALLLAPPGLAAHQRSVRMAHCTQPQPQPQPACCSRHGSSHCSSKDVLKHAAIIICAACVLTAACLTLPLPHCDRCWSRLMLRGLRSLSPSLRPLRRLQPGRLACLLAWAL